MKKFSIAMLGAGALVAAAAAFVWWPRDDAGAPASAAASALTSADRVARGAYLAAAGDCMACHTQRGGAPYAGGRTLPTPFGDVISPNISADRATGIGNWSADDFWGALHNGKSKDGRLLYPAFPYTSYTKLSRDDTDALLAYLQSLPAQQQVNAPQRLRFPFNQQFALAAWRALYFRPASYRADTRHDANWNRGAYLVQGLGHCEACHSARNQFGATEGSLSGGLIPILNWYAPSLTSDTEAGLGDWDRAQIAQLLKTGVAPRATVFGPMAEVVTASLQHVSDQDIGAMAGYLKSLPSTPGAHADAAADGPALRTMMSQGADLYKTHCADCHQADGHGAAPAYPPLAGNRAITMDEAINPIRIVLNGGFAPGTAGNPRPYGMPAYGPVLSDTEVAAVVTYLRNSWGNHAPPVSTFDVNRARSVPLD